MMVNSRKKMCSNFVEIFKFPNNGSQIVIHNELLSEIHEHLFKLSSLE